MDKVIEAVSVNDGVKKFTLPSGKTCEILPGKGKHARKAILMADGDGSKYLSALMMQLVLIDGESVVMEDLDEMPLADYMKLQAEFGDQNFTSPPGI